mgnify:CR=1 FL=1
MYKFFVDCLNAIQVGFTTRTREEMKPFNQVIGNTLVVSFPDYDKLKEKGIDEKDIYDAWEERAKSLSNWIIETCRFSRELLETEKQLDVDITIKTDGYVQMTPKNFLSAVVARYFEIEYAARLLDLAVSAAVKHFETLNKRWGSDEI